MEACRDLPNVWLETAASSSAAGAFEYVVDTVGADRVIYGSDVPLFDQRNEVARIATADIPDESKKKILGLNAIKLLDLENLAAAATAHCHLSSLARSCRGRRA